MCVGSLDSWYHMSTVAEFTLAADEFHLGGLFQRLPAVTIELERVVPTGTGVVPYLWVSGVREAAVREVVASHPAIETMEVVDSIDDLHLIRAEWYSDHDGLLQSIADSGVSLLSGSGTATEWVFEIRAQERESIATFQELCQTRGLPIRITAVRRLSEDLVSEKYGLTPAQHEALRVAYDRGYFDDPRETTLEEVASSLGISRQALAARLRRAYRNLLETTVIRP